MKYEVIRHIDKLGRICIPMDFRKSFGITEDTKIAIQETKDGIILKVVNDCTLTKRDCLIKNSGK